MRKHRRNSVRTGGVLSGHADGKSPQGIEGSTGDKGDPGDIGPQGDKGNTGATGLVGPTGAQGLPGNDGKDGATGATGPSGPPGPEADPSLLAALQAQLDTICKNNPLICQPTKTVFVTSGGFTGAELIGLGGADALCQNAAQAAGLTGNYLAWLSDSTESPDLRFTKSTGPYALVTGTRIAESYSDLVDGTIITPIQVTETGDTLNTDLVWTGTASDGGPSKDNFCDDWSVDDSNPVTNIQVGRSDRANAEWTSFDLPVTIPITTISCGDIYRLYCFEQ